MRRLFRLWQLAGRDLGVLLSVLRSPYRPRWLLPALIVLAIFALEPFNFALPILGVVDDLFLLPLILRGLVKIATRGNLTRFSPASRDERVVSVQ